MTTPYTTGQISLVNGSAMVTGVGTGWATSLIIGGTIYVEADGGNALPILEIGSDTAITAAIAWTGPTGTYNYALVRDTAYGQQTVANAQALADYIQRLNSTALSAISGVAPASEMVLMFTGPDTATVVPRSAFIQGGEYDIQVNNLAARATYDSKPGPTATNRGFAVLVSNIGDGRAAIYSKLSDTAGDWSDPGPLTGAKGDSGPFTEITIGTTTTLPYGSQATVTSTVIDADTIRLDFGIPAGQNGTGTGDVVGPSSSVDNELGLFSGTSGKQIKRGPLLSSLGSGQNEAILALEIADLKGSRLGMKSGVADAFDDETGVDVKTNATYDAANDWYVPTGGSFVDQTATHTAATTSGNTVSASSQFGTNYEPWRAFDKVTGVSGGSSGTWAAANTATGWLQYQFATAKTIASYTIRSGNGVPNRAPSAWTLLGSNTGAFSGEQVVLDSRSGQNAWTSTGEVRRFSIATPGSYLYYRLNVTGTNGEALLQIDEVTLDLAGTLNNMTLVSVAYPLASVPTTARMTLQTVEFDTATPNTDFVAEFSRDGGTTWTAANLSMSPYLVVGNYKMYEAQPFSVTGQPSGSSMKWRARTLTNKNIAISGIVSQGN